MKYTDAMPPAFQKSPKVAQSHAREDNGATYEKYRTHRPDIGGEVRKRLKKKLVPQMDMDTDSAD